MAVDDRKLTEGTAITSLVATHKFYVAPLSGSPPWGHMAGSVLANYIAAGGTVFPVGTVGDGEFLKRSGTTFVGEDGATQTDIDAAVLGFAGASVQGFQMVQAADTDHDVTFGAGFAVDSTFAYALRTTTSMTKRIDAAWAVGDAAGGLDTGAVGNNLFYYHWIIRKDSDGSIDHLWSLSTSAPTMPAGYTYKRMSGWSVRTDGSANIIAFVHVGNRIYYKSPPGLEVDTTSLSTTRTNSTRSYLPAQRVVAICNVYMIRASADTAVYFSNPDLTDLASSQSVTPLAHGGDANNVGLWYQEELLTDASGVISYRAAGASTTLRVAPLGWLVP
jgi:hypothetical protein